MSCSDGVVLPRVYTTAEAPKISSSCVLVYGSYHISLIFRGQTTNESLKAAARARHRRSEHARGSPHGEPAESPTDGSCRRVWRGNCAKFWCEPRPRSRFAVRGASHGPSDAAGGALGMALVAPGSGVSDYSYGETTAAATITTGNPVGGVNDAAAVTEDHAPQPEPQPISIAVAKDEHHGTGPILPI